MTRSYHFRYSINSHSHTISHSMSDLGVWSVNLVGSPVFPRIESLLHHSNTSFHHFTTRLWFSSRTIAPYVGNNSWFSFFSRKNHHLFTKGADHQSSSCILVIFFFLKHWSLSQANQILNYWSHDNFEDYQICYLLNILICWPSKFIHVIRTTSIKVL